jgi:hypothetical protein
LPFFSYSVISSVFLVFTFFSSLILFGFSFFLFFFYFVVLFLFLFFFVPFRGFFCFG